MSRICTECKQTKTHCEFSKSKKGKFGLQSKCKECFINLNNKNKDKRKKYNEQNKDNIKKYYQENKHKYISKNQPNFKKNQQKYKKKLRKNPISKIKQLFENYIGKSIKNLNLIKHKSSFEIVGLESWELFREHIEKQFTEGMTWNNHGVGKNNTTWHIDHITPISSAQTEEDVYRLNHYTNLRPMWGSDNIRKSNKSLKN